MSLLGTIYVGGLCNFLSFVSPQQKFEATDGQLSFIWQAKENTSSRHDGGLPKRREGLNLGSSFYMGFLLPLSLLFVNWASQEGCLFHLMFLFWLSLWSLDFLLFHFHRLFLSLSFSHCHFGLLFPV